MIINIGQQSGKLKFGSSSVQTTLSGPPVVIPGSTFSGTTTRSDVDGGIEYTKAASSTAICWWTVPPLQVCGSSYGETLTIGVVADHYNGIEKVGFIADGGTEVFVYSTNIVDNVEQYTAVLNMSSKAAGEAVEVRAIAYPYHGRPRILQGELQTDPSIADTNKQGFYSLKCTKIADIQTTNIASGTSVLDAIASLGNFSASTTQHRLVFPAEQVEWFGASGRNTLTLGNIHETIPIILEGTGNRGTEVTNTTSTEGPAFVKGAYYIKNMTWIATRAPLRPKTSTGNANYFFCENCDVTAKTAPVADGWTHTDSNGESITVVSNPENKSGSRLFATTAYTSWNLPEQVVSSNSDEHIGLWFEGCNISWELGACLKWVKNCTSINNFYDAFHGGCMLNLDIQSAQLGTERPFLLDPTVLVWKANTDFATNVDVLIEVSPNTWQLARNSSGGVLNTPTFNAADWNLDYNKPHNDGWQPRVKEDGTGKFENIWLEGLTTDSDSVCQPMFYGEAESLVDMVWKRWQITNTTAYSSFYMSQINQHIDHWLMDDCVWWEEGATPQERSGELRINWITNVDRGWGQTLPNGSTVGCKNARWNNSALRKLVLSNSWPATVPTTLQAFEDQINGFAGWDISIDAFTKANTAL